MATRPDKRSIRSAACLAALLVSLVACGGAPEDGVVARVGDEEITVVEVADYMVRANREATEAEVRQAVDELIAMELLLARARERYEPAAAESVQMQEWEDVLLMSQFREDVIYEDIEVDEAELRAWYEENIGEETRARHILVSVPPNASDAQVDSLRRRADSLRQAIAGGADFAEVARASSADRGTAPQGGDLGWFGRGQMVEAFETAAFETEPGELAPIVRTPFGFHVIKVEGHRKRTFEELRDQIEETVVGPRRNEATRVYVDRLMETSGMEFEERNLLLLIGRIDADRPPPDEEHDLVLVTFDGGEIRLGEIWDLYETLPPSNRRRIDELDLMGMIRALSSMVQQRIVLQRAEAAGIELDSVRQGQLQGRIDALVAQGYLRNVAASRMEIPDSVARRYYEEHPGFYEGRSFEEAEEEVRSVLANQRMQELGSPEAQRELIDAIADSQARAVEVVRYEDAYDDVVEMVEERYERGESGERGPQLPTLPLPTGE